MKQVFKTSDTDTDIDIVIAWVDGNDPAWQKEKEKTYAATGGKADTDDREERYRDWDQFIYLFRGLERFAPWVRKIHLVTWGHLPSWLAVDHPKLHIVKHTDYIPEQYLPTFNSHTIEWNFHRIEGLSEHFVYFNDDFFLLQPTKPEDFFQNGKPVDMLALQPDVANIDNTVMPYIYLNNTMLLAKYFDKRSNMRMQPGAYFHFGYPLMYFGYNMLEMLFPRFTGFYTTHGPSPLKKETYKTLWSLEPNLLSFVCSHPFRSREDVSQYVLREYQKLSGDFVPRNIQKTLAYFDVSDHNEKLLHTIRRRNKQIVCINDCNHPIAFERVRGEIQDAFEEIFPEKSAFEK